MMTTGYTDQVKQFDAFLFKKYNEIRSQTQQIFWNEDGFEDALQDNVLRVRDRIIKSGFTSSNYQGYLWLANSNSYKLQQKRKTWSTHTVYNSDLIANLDVPNSDDHTSEDYYSKVDKKVKHLFNYLDEYHSDLAQQLFIDYYLNGKNTYQKIVEQSGLNFSTVKKNMSLLKRDLKLNLNGYIKYKELPEVWRTVKHYPLYEVSNKLNIRSLLTGKVIKPRSGYYLLKNEHGKKLKSIEQVWFPVFQPSEVIIYKRTV